MESMVDSATAESSSLHSNEAMPSTSSTSFDSKAAVSHSKYAPPYTRASSFNFPDTQIARHTPISYPVPSRERPAPGAQQQHLRVIN